MLGRGAALKLFLSAPPPDEEGDNAVTGKLYSGGFLSAPPPDEEGDKIRAKADSLIGFLSAPPPDEEGDSSAS